MKKVIFSIGIPGTGKTTILKDFAEHYGYDYICPDDLRLEINGNASDQRNSNLVWSKAFNLMHSSLDDGKTVVFDATQGNRDQRKKFVGTAREFGAEKIQGLLFDVPLETAKSRNDQRDRVIPDYVLERMNKSIIDFPPKLDEGIDSLFTVNDEGRITGLQRKSQMEHVGSNSMEDSIEKG